MNFGALNINKFVCKNIGDVLEKISFGTIFQVEEIRLRANRPIIIQDFNSDWFVDINGKLSDKNSQSAFVAVQHDLIKTLEIMSHNSIYAYQDDIKNGFITLQGGHRVGITGHTVMENNSVKTIKDISGLNIRIAREVIGCSKQIVKYIIASRNQIYNTLIISPPQCGKTTLLRDIARTIGSGEDSLNFRGLKVSIIDERSEIAACDNGVPQNDVGIRTDVFDACSKRIGMTIALRSMSPNVIITDEIGDAADKDSIMQIINAGIKIITTVHGYNISELKTRKEMLNMVTQKIFERYIVLSNKCGPGTLEEIFDGTTMNTLYKRSC